MFENYAEKNQEATNQSSIFHDQEMSNEFYEYFMNIAILRAKTRTNYKNQV